MTESSNMQLFQKAIWEATCNVYERELAACEPVVKCSRRHYARMRKILGVVVLPATTRAAKIKRCVIAALVAAALLLTGCTVYAYREEIREFIETVFEDYIRISCRDTENPTDTQTIAEYYTLGYVPEGYELTKTFELPVRAKYMWSGQDGAYILLEQCHVDSGLFAMDNEIEGWEVMQIGNHNVHHCVSNAYYYFWNDGVYAYRLKTSELWEEQVLRDMIENLRIKE